MTSTTPRSTTSKRPPLLRGGMVLALVLVGALWAASHFSAEARVRRATARIVRLVQKEAVESPVSLGLSASRLGDDLASDAVLELEGYGSLTTGRKDIVQFYVQVRNSFRQIEFSDPRITVVTMRDGEVRSDVAARYRFVTEGGETVEGDGQATLRWVNGDEGWQIAHALLKPDPTASVPKGWL